jgi:membrane protease YdiL (CAAX protease family)
MHDSEATRNGAVAPSSRSVSAMEFVLGGAIVIAANVYRAIPSEVLVLGVLALLSLRLRSGGWRWSTLGFTRPVSWRRVVLIALAAAALRIVLGALAIDPLTALVWPPAKAPELVQELTGNLPKLMLYLPLIWVYAALGEEWAYRGYLMHRGAHALGGSTIALLVSAVLVAVLFGYGHYYKGPAGIVDSGIAGLILALAYLAAGRTLWVCVLAHGFIDTFGLIAVYLGWDI